MNPVATEKVEHDKISIGATRMKIAVVVPAYNEEALIRDTLDNIPNFVDRAYIVDDGSTDATGQIVQAFNDPRVCYIQHHRNGGVGAAIVTGYRKCLEDGMDIAIVMAGDNQMDPAHALKLLQPILDGSADYSKGDRLSIKGYQTGMSKWRHFGNWVLTLLTRIAAGNWHIIDPQNGYTAITSEALRKIDLDHLYPGYGYCNDMLVKLHVNGCRVADVPMPARYGHEKSKIKYSRYIPRVAWLLLRDLLWQLKMTSSK
jgi:glycosyltransferase involved in cell wall biosynthesis